MIPFPIVVALAASPSLAAPPSEAALFQLTKCDAAVSSRSSCNHLVGHGLKLLYSIDDSKVDGGWMLANDMVQSAVDSPLWQELGRASDPAVLSAAQQKANEGLPVIAGLQDPGAHGHVALILAGDLVESGTWANPFPAARASSSTSPTRPSSTCRSRSPSSPNGAEVRLFARGG